MHRPNHESRGGSEPPAVEIRGVWFAYDGRAVLREVDLRIERGELLSIVGPNGGGKTTLLKLILGLIRPQRGSVSVFGLPPAECRRRIGYTPQHALFDPGFPMSALDVVLMGRLGRARWAGPFSSRDRAAAREALEEVAAADLRGRSFAQLSGGERQRVLIARALTSEPELLLLDEPTANLDVGVEQDLYELLNRLSRRLTVVMVSHDVGVVSQWTSRVACVRGTVAVHPTAELTGELMRDLYGQDIRLVRHDHDCLRECRPEDQTRDERGTEHG